VLKQNTGGSCPDAERDELTSERERDFKRRKSSSVVSLHDGMGRQTDSASESTLANSNGVAKPRGFLRANR